MQDEKTVSALDNFNKPIKFFTDYADISVAMDLENRYCPHRQQEELRWTSN
ncbi:MAG: hypothetical protein LBT89_03915 [Planctomycetaceae bacterium]|jgi:hypothetical protein|nr:hypothetical protein [Planctomycetaceae bacterium]